jgi:hypothetical protein
MGVVKKRQLDAVARESKKDRYDDMKEKKRGDVQKMVEGGRRPR